MPLRPKLTPPWGHMRYIDLYREKHEQIVLSETIRPRAMILVCSITLWIMPLGPKMVPPWGSHIFLLAYIGKHWKIFLFETIRFRALIFGHILTSTSLVKLCPWGQNNPAPGSPGTWSAFYRYLYISFKQNSGERFRAIWPSCFITEWSTVYYLSYSIPYQGNGCFPLFCTWLSVG